jgi:D-alanyl-D-alanine carboxypeptidase
MSRRLSYETRGPPVGVEIASTISPTDFSFGLERRVGLRENAYETTAVVDDQQSAHSALGHPLQSRVVHVGSLHEPSRRRKDRGSTGVELRQLELRPTAPEITHSPLPRGAAPLRRLTTTAAIVVVAALVLAGCAATGSNAEPDLGKLLDRVVDAGAPGAFVVLRQDGKVRVEERGVSENRRSTPIRADERFRVGSVTKTFVAALVLRLVEDGRLSLDDPVGRWLPGLLPNGRTISVRHLLSHTSGLFDYVEDEQVLRSPERRWSPERLVSVALAHAPEQRVPGRTFAYSSTNYVVLGLIAEKAGGAPLERQLRARLFGPLGLRATSFVPGLIRGRHVHGHRPPSHQGIVTGLPADTSDEPARWTWAAGAIVSTADDVQRFFAALLQGRIVGPTLLREMEELVPAGANRYGLGIATFPTPCGPAWGHTGNVQGTIAVAWNSRDAARQVVLVVNTYPLSAELEAAVRELQLAAFCAAP